jgi:hypothetical protein
MLRDKYCADVSGRHYYTDDPVDWLNKYYIPFLELPKIKPLMSRNGQPRDVRESEDGEWIGFNNPRGRNIGILLSYPFNSSIPLETLELREHHYAETIYNLIFNMGWFEEILGALREEVFRKQETYNRRAIARSVRHEIFVRDNYRCLECGATNKDTTLHIDHIIPISQGGSNDKDNLQTLCKKCNLSKNNATWKGGEE